MYKKNLEVTLDYINFNCAPQFAYSSCLERVMHPHNRVNLSRRSINSVEKRTLSLFRLSRIENKLGIEDFFFRSSWSKRANCYKVQIMG